MKFGLRLKIAIFTSSLILFIGIGLFGALVYEEQVTIHKLRMDASRDTALKTASLVENHLYNLDVRELRYDITSVLESGGVDLAWVLDDQGRLISDGSNKPALRNKKPPVPFIDELIAAKTVLSGEGETHHWVGAPVDSGREALQGYVVVAFTQKHFDFSLWPSLLTQLTVLGPALLIGMVAAFFFGQRITRPLNTVTKIAQQVGAGNWDVAADIESNDEVGELARAINAMAENLSHIAVSRDKLEKIVETKTAELTQHRENLEKLVDERTHELRRAKEEADSANKAKSDFLSSMSHELRTPLNAILGFAQILELNAKQPLTEGQNNAVHHIKNGGAHLLELVNDVLNLAKIETRGLELSMENVETHNLMKECLPLAEAMAAKRGVTIETKQCKASVLWADYTRMKQVLLNLLSNAVKYNCEGGSIIVKCEAIPGEKLRISVTDTGDGIAADQQDKLFLPFSRLGQENSSIEGTGIGLVITKQIIEGIGGSIGFESTQGKGSTFWVDVPLSVKRERPKDEVKIAVTPADQMMTKARGRILYIEDNPANITLMETMLGDTKGFELKTAHTAELGVEMAKMEKPDLILMDINLPGMSGIEALAELRRDEETRNIPAIAISAAATAKEVEKGLKSGFDAYLTKPIDIKETLSVIDGILLKTKK